MSTEWDDLERGLHDLGTDLGDGPLPGPHAARTRARQRTRRQVAGATIGAVAAAAVGAVVLGGLGPLSISQPDPADTPTPTPSGEIIDPNNALTLTVDDLEASSGADEPVGWQEVDPLERFACAPAPGDADTDADKDADMVVERWFQASPDGHLNQIVEISTADEAEQRFNDLTAELRSCVENGGEEFRIDQIWSIDGIGDQAWTATYSAPPRTEEAATIVIVSVVQVGDSVTTVTQGGLAQDFNLRPGDDLPMLAATRLCEASGSRCEFAAEPHRVYPEAQPDLPGWLTVDDVALATGFDFITEGGAVADAGGSWGFACLENNPIDYGARSVEVRSYVDPTFAVEASVYQSTAVFESAQQARDHFDALVADASACDAGSPAEEIAQVSGGGYVGVGWRSTDEEYGTSFVFGAVVNGPFVSIVTFAEDSVFDLYLEPDQVRDLLDRAGQRLDELE
jgi:hypothetical protein